MKQRKRYSAEFRVQAVELLKERLAAGSSIKRVGEELELNPDLLWAWSREVDQAPPALQLTRSFQVLDESVLTLGESSSWNHPSVLRVPIKSSSD